MDLKALNLSDLKDPYAININTGKVYDIKGMKYGGLMYYTPEYGLNGKGELIEKTDDDDSIEDEENKISVHYLPGYDEQEEKVYNIENQKSITIENNMFNRATYQFVGWKDVTSTIVEDEITEQEADETEIETSEIVKEDEEIIYYGGEEVQVDNEEMYLQAIWTQNTITLDANGGTVNGNATISYPVIPGKEYGELPDAEREGYVFGGWHTDNGTFNNQIVEDDIYNENVTTLYAYWVERPSGEPNQAPMTGPVPDSNIITITYNPNGGEWRRQADKEKTVVTKEIVKGKKIGTLPNSRRIKKDNYNYDCWTLSDKTTKVKASYIPTENITLYTRYTIHMIYNYQGGTGKRVYKNVKIGGIRGILNNGAKKEGYKVEGWYIGPNATGDKLNYRYRINQTQDFTVYAHWLKKCTISYDLNCESEGLIVPKNKYVYQSAKIGYLANPKRTSFKFEGWYKEPECVTKIEKTYIVDKDITLYAKWERLKATITFNSDGGAGSMEVQEVEQGVETKINKNTFTKEYYNFAGWKDNKGNSYTDEGNIKVSANTTLTAQWEPWTHTVQYNLNYETAEVVYTTQTKRYGEELAVPDTKPLREGYTFVGWGTEATSKTSSYLAGDTYSREQDGGIYNLYAIWTEVQVTTISTSSTHNVKDLSYNWSEINTCAKVISDNYVSASSNTKEVTVKVNGKTYILGVGDTATVKYSSQSKKVRIIGFNHDTLSRTDAYGGNNTYAGISFEFAETLGTEKMHSKQTNKNGWGACNVKTTLNGSYLTSLKDNYNSTQMSNYIKTVNKKYMPTYNSTSTSTSQDSLWLLACSEIWSNGKYGYGFARKSEGAQYKYYKDIGATYSVANSKLTKSDSTWWLRSPYYSGAYSYCRVLAAGNCKSGYADTYQGIAPGFSI